MALNDDIKQLLGGFEKRMKFINLVSCLLNYRYPDNIRAMFPQKQILDNLIIAVVVYIKERTLGTQESCTLNDIECFLEKISVVLPADCYPDCKTLSKYIIVDVLQNGGIMNEFLTLDSVTETFVYKEIRLLNEQNRNYYLTNDALDFLFRSKEIESELDYSVARFKVRESLKRGNYSEALEASRELVSRIRSMKVNINDFSFRCRENISRITIDQYEDIMLRIRSLLDNEYEELTRIQESAKEHIINLANAQNVGLSEDELKNQYIALKEIVRNITLTISEQRGLINKRSSLSEMYGAILSESLLMNSLERMSFEQDILRPLRQTDDRLGDAASFFLFMLTKPRFDNMFSVENFYEVQTKLTDNISDEGIEIGTSDNPDNRIVQEKNERNLAVIKSFFSFACDHSSFAASEFIESLRVSELIEMSDGNALPNILIFLLSLLRIDVEEWNDSEKLISVPNGEFDLSWCLSELPQEYLNMKMLEFSSDGSRYSFKIVKDESIRQIDITDFHVHVM